MEVVDGQFYFESHFWVKLWALYQRLCDFSYEIGSTASSDFSSELQRKLRIDSFPIFIAQIGALAELLVMSREKVPTLMSDKINLSAYKTLF